MANKQERRLHNIERLQAAGIEDKKALRRMRDWSADRLTKAINEYKEKDVLPAPNPSDIPKRTPIADPIRIPEPPPQKFPPPAVPDGKIVVLWKDVTKRGRSSRYPNALKEIKQLKSIMRKQDPEAILGYIKKMLEKDDGKIGDVEIKLYKNEEQLRQIKKEFKGWQIIYNGKGKSKKDLLIGLAAVVTGVYNLALTKAAASFFIAQVKKIHPANGQWLDDLYKNI